MRKRSEQICLAVLLLLALAHGLAYALIVPAWQAPDEPFLYEYAALTAALGRMPRGADHSPALDERILASLNRQHFWTYTLPGKVVEAPQTMEAALELFRMPRQGNGDPPLYFALAALPLRATAHWLPEVQVRLLRILNAALLPLLVLCAYGAAVELRAAGARDAPAGGSAASTQPPPGPMSLVPLATASLLALHPMLAFVGASAGNDGLASVLSAGFFWAGMRAIGRGVTARRMVVLLLLLLSALLAKRTALPLLLPAALIVAGWLARQSPRRTLGRLQPADRTVAFVALGRSRGAAGRPGRTGPAIILASLAAAGLLAWQYDWRTAAGWSDADTGAPAVRYWQADGQGPSLSLEAGDGVAQLLPAVASDRIRGGSLRFGARAWSDGEAAGRLIVHTDRQTHEIMFDAGSRAAQVETSATVYPENTRVTVELRSDRGRLYVDDLWSRSDTFDVLANGSIDLPGLKPGSPLATLAGYLRLPDLLWAIGSGGLVGALPEDWGALLFASFWGEFGWMSLPFVRASAWIAALAVFCIVGLGGILVWLGSRGASRRQRLQVGALAAVAATAPALLTLNALTSPSYEALQQGRYLFPVIVPLTILLSLGHASLVPPGWRPHFLAAWLGGLAIFAGGALIYVATRYHT